MYTAFWIITHYSVYRDIHDQESVCNSSQVNQLIKRKTRYRSGKCVSWQILAWASCEWPLVMKRRSAKRIVVLPPAKSETESWVVAVIFRCWRRNRKRSAINGPTSCFHNCLLILWMCHHFHLPQGSLSTFWFVYYFLCGYGAFIFFSVMKKSPQTPNSSCFSHRGECGCTNLKANASPFKNSCRVCRDSSVCKKKKVKLWWWQWFNKIRRCSEREWMLWWLSQAINSILLTRLLCSFCPWQVLYYICNITHSFERRSRNVLLWLSFVYILTANRDTLQWPLTFAKGEVLVTCYPSLKIYTKIKKYYKKWKTKKGKKSSARYWIPVTSPKLSSPSKKPDSNCDIS